MNLSYPSSISHHSILLDFHDCFGQLYRRPLKRWIFYPWGFRLRPLDLYGHPKFHQSFSNFDYWYSLWISDLVSNCLPSQQVDKIECDLLDWLPLNRFSAIYWHCLAQSNQTFIDQIVNKAFYSTVETHLESYYNSIQICPYWSRHWCFFPVRSDLRSVHICPKFEKVHNFESLWSTYQSVLVNRVRSLIHLWFQIVWSLV